MSHAIDEFCRQYDLQNKELAERLGVPAQQINDWKRGRRNIPVKHKESMYKLFGIPFNKQYLLEVDYVTEIDKKEIFILKHKATIENEPVDSMILPKLKMEVKANEREIEVLKLMDKISRKIFDTSYMDEVYESNIEKVNKLIDELD